MIKFHDWWLQQYDQESLKLIADIYEIPRRLQVRKKVFVTVRVYAFRPRPVCRFPSRFLMPLTKLAFAPGGLCLKALYEFGRGQRQGRTLLQLILAFSASFSTILQFWPPKTRTRKKSPCFSGVQPRSHPPLHAPQDPCKGTFLNFYLPTVTTPR
jgi:hypothetical protein